MRTPGNRELLLDSFELSGELVFCEYSVVSGLLLIMVSWTMVSCCVVEVSFFWVVGTGGGNLSPTCGKVKVEQADKKTTGIRKKRVKPIKRVKPFDGL